MYITISDLFCHRQYTTVSPSYCFDRKAYAFCDSSWLSSKNSGFYVRYIPLFQVDQTAIEHDFLVDSHNKHILHKYNASNVCFEEFIQRNNLWFQWWDYYQKKVKQIAIQWCENNSINYRDE